MKKTVVKRYITLDDFNDLYGKLVQRGWAFIASKFTWNKLDRTRSAFNTTARSASNWWHVPKVCERWNKKITGDANLNFKQFLVNDIFKDQQDLKLISLGCGEAAHEMELATYSNFEEITCVDVVQSRLDAAVARKNDTHLAELTFICESIYNLDLKKNHYDVVFFNASLHHFENIKHLLTQIIKPCLKKGGYLVINEYVGADRLQFPQHQIQAINEALQLIPKPYRKRFKRNTYKKKFYGSGWWRMIIADPSECVDSSSIMPVIHDHFATIYERSYGGNILMNVLKDISYHFETLNTDNEQVLQRLFDFEDHYLKHYETDFIFGIYRT